MAEHDRDIEQLFHAGQEEALDAYLQLLHPADIAELFRYVDEDNWTQITARLEPEALAEVLADLDEGQRATIGDALHTDRLIRVFDELETDDAADVLADISDEKSALILDSLADRTDITTLMSYPEDSAGGIMQSEVCTVLEEANVTDAIESVRSAREEMDDIIEVYVIDSEGRLKGTLALEVLVLSQSNARIETLTAPVEHKVMPQMDQEEVARLFRKYDIASLPVVNNQGHLLGRITFDDIHDVLEEEASEDIIAMAGTSAAEDLVYSDSYVRIAAFRLPWLIGSLAGSLMTAHLVAMFDKIPSNAIILASFVPVVMAMSGNLGSQSAMIITRGLAIGRVDFATLGQAFVREGTVGLLLGGAAGSVVGLYAQLTQGTPQLGVVVGSSLIASMTISSMVGVLAPAMFKRFGIDPAIAAGPLVTTSCDLLGVAIYLSVALSLII